MAFTKKRFYFLDSLRGIAALMVASAHFIERTPLHGNCLFKYVNLGQIGVVVFFILSGMVIPFSLRSGRREVLNFCISRFFRLYPAYWFSIFLAIITSIVVSGNYVSVKTALVNMTMLQSLAGIPDLFGVYWTLIIEMFFYFLCVCFFLFGSLNDKKVIFLTSWFMLAGALALAVIRFYMDRKVPVAIPLCMSLMFFGSLWREVSLGTADLKTKRMTIIWMLSFFFFLIPVCLLAYSRNYGHNENAISYIVSYAIGVTFTLLFTTKFKLEMKSFVFLGTISYSIYLVHQFFLEIAYTNTDIGNIFNFSVFIAYLFSVVILASVTYFLIEKPSIYLGRKVRGIVNQ